MSKTHKSRSLIAVGIALALAAPIAATAAEKVRVGLAAPGYTPYAPVHAANDLGYYKAKGLEVELTVYRGGGAAQQALAANAADIINYFPPGMALAVKKGVKEKIVAAGGTVTPHGWHMLVRADSAVRSLADLAGKKIGVTSKASTTDFYALWAANEGGGKAQNIPLGGRGLVPALKKGDIDAAVLWPNLTLRLIESGQYRSLVNYGKVMKPNLPEVWVAAQSFIDTKPQVINGFLEAVMKATKYMQENRGYALQYIKKFTKEKNDSTVATAYEAITRNASTDGMMDRETLERSLSLARLGGIADLPPVDQIFTSQFLPINPN